MMTKPTCIYFGYFVDVLLKTTLKTGSESADGQTVVTGDLFQWIKTLVQVLVQVQVDQGQSFWL